MTKPDDDGPARCAAKTTAGRQCLRYALPGGDRCASHTFKIPGRPTKLNAKITAQILEAILEGNYRETAAQVAGISKRTLYNWIARGEEHIDSEQVPKGEGIYVDFLHALKSAEAHAEIRLLRQASNGGFGWQAQMTVLERKYPDKWGRRDTTKIEHTGKIKTEIKLPTDAEWQGAVAEVLQAAGALPVPDGSGNGNGHRPDTD